MSGSLKTMLRDLSIPLSWRVRLTFAYDISRGMSYLHEHGMLHRDLKADNCFVDNKTMRVKVADFGTGHVSAPVADTDIKEERKSRTLSMSTTKSLSSSLSSARSRLDTRSSRNRRTRKLDNVDRAGVADVDVARASA
jgi:serine/threonine protein kinase